MVSMAWWRTGGHQYSVTLTASLWCASTGSVAEWHSACSPLYCVPVSVPVPTTYWLAAQCLYGSSREEAECGQATKLTCDRVMADRHTGCISVTLMQPPHALYE